MADQIPDSAKLLPCPFCGGEAQSKTVAIRDGQTLSCRNLKCMAGVAAFNPDAADKCISRWNSRADVATRYCNRCHNSGEIMPAGSFEMDECPDCHGKSRQRSAAPPAMDREAVERAAIERCASIVEGFFSPNAAAEQIYAAQIAAEIRALSTLSADAIRQGEGWQPIETAPRDGTILDLWIVFPAYEDKPESTLRSADSFWSEKRKDWMTRGGFTLTQYAAKPVATHWMRRPDGPATPASHASDGGKGVEKDVAFLCEAARYFAGRPTDGEDRAHWSNVANSENCQRIANRLSAWGEEA